MFRYEAFNARKAVSILFHNILLDLFSRPNSQLLTYCAEHSLHPPHSYFYLSTQHRITRTYSSSDLFFTARFLVCRSVAKHFSTRFICCLRHYNNGQKSMY